jgi:glycosyltransferase involved in cell wall biosynthesis
LDVFLQTAARIRVQLPQAYFVLCGGGPLEKELKTRAERLGIAAHLRFPGWVSDMRPYYRAWDIMLFNSDLDTLPRAPMEAASYGCVLVASLLYGGLGEFVQHGHNGYLIDQHDHDELARLVVALANDGDRAAKFRQVAVRELAERFSPEHEAAFYREFFGL